MTMQIQNSCLVDSKIFHILFSHQSYKKWYIWLCLVLASCALLGRVFPPDLEEEKKDSFFEKTGHEMLKMLQKEQKLGYLCDNGVFIKKVWGGKIEEVSVRQDITLVYRRNDFDKLKLLLGSELSVGPGLENVYYIILKLEDIKQYRLDEPQPLIQYMGPESLELLQKPFVISMIKVTRYSVTAYQQGEAELEGVYIPHPLVRIQGSTGSKSTRESDEYGYNAFVGYKTYDGSEWVQKYFEHKPKADLVILNPLENDKIPEVRLRLQGSILNYSQIPEEYQNQLRIYLMVQDEYQNDYWLLQSKAVIDRKTGHFGGMLMLGTLQSGNGHRYSIVAFATYFDINREANSKIPFLPFNKGQALVNVQRQDNF